MKDLIIGDPHARKNNLNKIEMMLQYCQKLAVECDRTIISGDLFDEKAYLRTEAVNLYLKYFKDWPGSLYLLVGNHDYSNSIECKTHALEVFKSLLNVIVVDKFHMDESTIFLPYKPNDEILSLLNDLKIRRDNALLYGHSGIDGCQYSSGSFEASSIKKEHFKGFKKVFMGHIHKPQSFDNIIYVGTPFSKDYGEANENKRVIIYDHETNTEQNIFLPIPQHKVVEYEITSLKDLAEIKEKLKQYTNNTLKVIIKAPETIAKKVKAASFDISIDSLKIETIKEKTDRTTISESLSFNDMCKQYLLSSQTELDVVELSKLSDEILKEAECSVS